jgi:TonB-dependent SusC/RagA subfamily outer membrane receptor
MLPFYFYILKMIMVSLVLLGYYWISLRNTRFHHYNRFYLVATVALSMLLPLLDLNWFTIDTPQSKQVQEVIEFVNKPMQSPKQLVEWDLVLFLGLIFISVILLSIFLFGIFKLMRLKSMSKITVTEHFDFVETSIQEAPFSFFKNLFWRKDLSIQDEIGQRILKHELTHIKEHHSLDKVIVAISTYLFWMNPVFWIIRRELEVVQEFIADEKAIGEEDASLLAAMLLKSHYPSSILSVGQSFFYSSIKRRIIMLTSSKKVSYSYARRILVLPIAITIIALLSFTIKDQLDQNQIMYESVLQDQLDSIPVKYRDPKTGKIKGSFQIDIEGDNAIFKDVKTKKKLFEIPLNELGGNKPADRIEIFMADEMVSGQKNQDVENFIFIADSSVLGKQIKEEKKFIFIADGNSKVDTLLLMKEGFPISPVPPPAPPAPPKPVIIINGKVIFPSEDNSIDPSTLKTIDIRGIVPDKKQATSKMVWTESTYTNAEGGRQVITITVDSTKNKSESSGLTGKVSKVIIKTKDDPIVAMAEKDPTTISINSTDEKGKKVYTIVRTEKNLTELPKDVLYIMDGKEISQKEMNDLSPTLIQSISIIKGESAIALFGERGKNGVVEIKTKK